MSEDGMSESVAEGSEGVTGEAGVQGGDAFDSTAAEDAAAEQQLAGIMQEHDPDELMKQINHWKQTAQRHERTARDNSKAAAKLRELEEAQKSDLQKATEAREAAERERDAVIMQQNRMMAAAAHNLHADLIDYLGDGSAEEITARAEQLAGIIEARAQELAEEMTSHQPARQPNGGRPVVNMRPGAAPSDARVSSPDEMFRQLMFGSE
jgi:hypothetical protein